MNAKKSVFPTGFSHCRDAALEYATGLDRDSNGLTLIVHAEEPTVAHGDGETYDGVLEPDYRVLEKMPHEIKPTDLNVAFEHRLLRRGGNPANKLARFAKEEQADLIVMGTDGRTGFGRKLLGSVAEAVVWRGPCRCSSRSSQAVILSQRLAGANRGMMIPLADSRLPWKGVIVHV